MVFADVSYANPFLIFRSAQLVYAPQATDHPRFNLFDNLYFGLFLDLVKWLTSYDDHYFLFLLWNCFHFFVLSDKLYQDETGGKGALVSPEFNVKSIPTTDLANAFSNSDEAKMDEKNLATYVVFCAARANELDYETYDDTMEKGFGSLSYALNKV